VLVPRQPNDKPTTKSAKLHTIGERKGTKEGEIVRFLLIWEYELLCATGRGGGGYIQLMEVQF